MVGNRGQASYAATTGYLDAFSAYCNRQGRPATTLDLGVIQGVGYVAERGGRLLSVMDDYLGVEVVREGEFLALLGAAIQGKIGQEGAWHTTNGLRLKPNIPEPAWLSEPKFSYLRRVHNYQQRSGKLIANDTAGQTATATATADKIADRLKNVCSLEQGRRIAYEAIAAKLSETLGLAPDDITPDKTTASYGLDSILAVSVQNWIKERLVVRAPFLDLLLGGTLENLAEHVLRNSKIVKSGIMENCDR